MPKRSSRTINKKKNIPVSSSSYNEDSPFTSTDHEQLNNYAECRRLMSENEERCYAIHAILFTKKRILKHNQGESLEDDLKFIKQMSENEQN